MAHVQLTQVDPNCKQTEVVFKNKKKCRQTAMFFLNYEKTARFFLNYEKTAIIFSKNGKQSAVILKQA